MGCGLGGLFLAVYSWVVFVENGVFWSDVETLSSSSELVPSIKEIFIDDCSLFIDDWLRESLESHQWLDSRVCWLLIL
jgi:hypothetical protein